MSLFSLLHIFFYLNNFLCVSDLVLPLFFKSLNYIERRSTLFATDSPVTTFLGRGGIVGARLEKRELALSLLITSRAMTVEDMLWPAKIDPPMF